MVMNSMKYSPEKERELSARFQFRSKFKAQLIEEEKLNVLLAFERFCEMSVNRARLFLWQLTYDETFAAEKLEEELNLTVEKEKILLYRNELRYHYAEHCAEDFLTPETESEEIQKAHLALLAKSDMIVASQVFYKCQKHVTHELEGDKQKTIFLLKSDLENLYCGGMKSLGFKWDEVTYLKQFRHEISKLYNSLYDFYKNKFNPLENKPLEGLKDFVEKLRPSPLIQDMEEETEIPEAKMESETTNDEAMAKCVDVATKAQNLPPIRSFLPITPEVIMSLKDNFEAFLKSLDDISELGLNPLEVIEQKKKIRSFLNVLRDF